MTLADFKHIYWWEFAHRFLGRLIGLVFAAGLAWFAIRREIPKGYGWKMLGLLVLGGAQGLLGWYMVMSGLAQRTDVSHLRLSAHLLLALAIMGALIWVALDLRRLAATGQDRPSRVTLPAAATLAILLVQVMLGAWVAGLNAGQVASDWPLMQGRFFPDRSRLEPWRRLGADQRPLSDSLPPPLVGMGGGGRAGRVRAQGAPGLAPCLGRDPRRVRHANPARNRNGDERRRDLARRAPSGGRRAARRRDRLGRARGRRHKPMSVVSVYALFANADEAERIGRTVIEERLAACINIFSPIRSIYRWQGAIETADETAAIFKTTNERADALIARIAGLHSYDVPCVVSWPIDKITSAYAAGSRTSVSQVYVPPEKNAYFAITQQPDPNLV